MKTNNDALLKTLIKWIESQPRFKPKTDLNRMKSAMKMRNIHFNGTYMIHVTGTNGKGSVVEFLTQIFLAQGLSVGTFSSPYILDFGERLKIDGKPLNQASLIVLLSDLKSFNDTFEMYYHERLSFFELLTLAALITFSSQPLDVVIMEVGIGGLLDATNAYEPYDLSVITNIGYDHMQQLGNTLESIALNKLGILRENGRLVTTVNKDLYPLFRNYAKPLNVDLRLLNPTYDILSETPLKFIYEHEQYTSGLTGHYQIKNAILAIEAARMTPFNITTSTIKKGLSLAFLPGRFQEIRPRVIVDGAHNLHAIDALEVTLKSAFPTANFHVIFSALGDKDITNMLRRLKTFASVIDLVSFSDVRYESLEKYQQEHIYYISEDLMTHVNRVFNAQRDDDVIVITGSLHFVGYFLNHMK